VRVVTRCLADAQPARLFNSSTEGPVVVLYSPPDRPVGIGLGRVRMAVSRHDMSRSISHPSRCSAAVALLIQ